MSRIAKKVIMIPEKAEVKINGQTLNIKGPLGEQVLVIDHRLKAESQEGGILLSPLHKDLLTQALWGTYASILRNHLKGVTEGFEKKLVVEGIGFKSDVKGKELVMSLGFSHQVKVPIPEGLEVKMEKMVIVVKGMNKELVGSFAAGVREKKKPEPYKGKGIRYETEVIRRKQGKKSV